MSSGAGGWEIRYTARQMESDARSAEQRNRPSRRAKLQRFAMLEFKRPNRCQALINIVAKAADQVEKENLSAYYGSGIHATPLGKGGAPLSVTKPGLYY